MENIIPDAILFIFDIRSTMKINADVFRIIGIKPPGYEERRRQRLKEKYGVEINPVKATAD